MDIRTPSARHDIDQSPRHDDHTFHPLALYGPLGVGRGSSVRSVAAPGRGVAAPPVEAAGADAGAVGRAATSAVVMGITLIVAANAVIDWLAVLVGV